MSIGSEITQLLINQGNVQATRALQQGAVGAQALQGAGQAAAQAIQLATDPARLEYQRTLKGRQALAARIKATPLKNGTPDYEGIASGLGADGFPDLAASWLSSATKNKENLTKLDEMGRAAQKAAEDYQAHQMAMIGDAAYHAKTKDEFTSTVGILALHGQLGKTPQENEQRAQAILQQADQAGPDGWMTARQQYVQFSPAWTKEQEELRKPEKLGQGEQLVRGTGEVLVAGAPKPLVLGQGDTAVDPATGAIIATGGPKAADEFQTFKQSYPQTLGKANWAALSPDEQVAALGVYAESKADPAMRAAALAQKNLAEMLAKAQLQSMPTPDQAQSVADDLVHHRIAPEQLATLFSTRGKEGLAFKLAVTAAAKKMDPSFNFEEASAEYNLVRSQGFQNTVRYMDSVQESMPRLMQSATQLGNGQFRTWNQILNAGKNQFNSTDLKRFKTDALLVGDEVAKILSGGGSGSATSDAKLKQATDIISTSDSVPAIAAAIEEIRTLIGFRRQALTRGTYMEGTSAGKPASNNDPLGIR